MNTKTMKAKLGLTLAALGCLAQAHGATLMGQLGVLDVEANGGINPGTGAAWQVGDTYRLVFATSGFFTATSTDIADYNSVVTTAASNAGLSGNWFAVGRTLTSDVQITTNTLTATTGVGILRMDSEVVANDYADFWDGTLGISINVDETGTAIPTTGVTQDVWTGLVQPHPTLGANTALRLGGTNVILGKINETGTVWARQSNTAATNEKRLYGMSDVLTISAIPEPSAALLGGLGLLALLRRRRN